MMWKSTISAGGGGGGGRIASAVSATLRRKLIVPTTRTATTITKMPAISTTTTTTTTSTVGCTMFTRAMSTSTNSNANNNNNNAVVIDKWGAITTSSDVIHKQKSLQFNIIPKSNHGEYIEYSVIHTDRSLNLMSSPFQTIMKELNILLKTTYSADKVAIMPGSGTYGMESVARQFATDKHVMVLRNGWFSFRWTEIFDMGKIPKSHTVLKAQPQLVDGTSTTTTTDIYQYAPYPIEQVIDKIMEERPAVFFCPHVETSTGMMISDIYIKTIADAIHSVGGILVLDCIASGTVWVDMNQLGVDVIISAPQKGWTGAPCAALIMMSQRAVDTMATTQETSFSCSLKRWTAIMDTYEQGGFGYHTTMPTDALRDFHEISVETLQYGLPELKDAQNQLGWYARSVLDTKQLISVAAPGCQAPGVLVYYSPINQDNPTMMKRFKQYNMQIAMGVPWRIDEPNNLKTFRIGLFGLDKLKNINNTINIMEHGIDCVLSDITNEATNTNSAADTGGGIAPTKAA